MGIVSKRAARQAHKHWVKTMYELNEQLAQPADGTRAHDAEADEEMTGLFKSQGDLHPAPVFVHPIQRRWFFCSLGASAFYFSLYGTGLLAA